MKKNFKYFGITWFVGLVLFNAITFLIPNEIFGVTRFDKGVFWISYALISIAFIIQIVTAYIFLKDDSKEKTFLKIPLLITGYATLGTSLIVGLKVMVAPFLPTWVGAIICLFVVGYFVIACVKAVAVADIVSSIDEKIKVQTKFLKLATVEAQNIMERATNVEIKTQTKRVYEALRYSDPMSNSALEEIEKDINEKLHVIKKAVIENNYDNVKNIAEELLLLIKERNNKCKILK